MRYVAQDGARRRPSRWTEAGPGRTIPAGPSAGPSPEVQTRSPPPMFLSRLTALALFALAPTLVSAEAVTGTATYRERILPPPGAVFLAVIQDVSSTGGKAVDIGQDEQTDPEGPPFRFSIEYDPAAIDPTHRYVVRTTLRDAGGALLFTSDTVTPVITGGAPTTVEMQMVAVAQPSGAAGAPVPPAAQEAQRDVRGLTLPATYTGTLPCADCEGISHHLDLWPDHGFHLRRQWLGRDATAEASEIRRDAIGLWAATPGSNVITLHGSDEPPLQFEATDATTLRQFDQEGAHIESDLPYDLTTDGTLDETDIEHLLMSGMMVYMADAASFTDCITGQDYPIAMEEDYPALEEAYLAQGTGDGAPLYVETVGSLLRRPAMEGPDKRSLVAENFIRTRPGLTCERQRADSQLVNTYWRFDLLRGETVEAVDDAREPYMVLNDSSEPRYVATAGCNRITGVFAASGEHLNFQPGATTRMACPPPLDAMETTLTDTLAAVAQHQIRGETMVLYDDVGMEIAVLSAVHLR